NAWRTYVFALQGQEAGPLAIGTGTSRGEALQDAYERLVQRRVALTAGPGRAAAVRLQDAVGAAARRVAAVRTELATPQAPVDFDHDLALVHEATGRYRAVSQMGHAYVNDETHLMAVTLSNESALVRRMATVGFNPSKAQLLLGASAKRAARDAEID